MNYLGKWASMIYSNKMYNGDILKSNIRAGDSFCKVLPYNPNGNIMIGLVRI